MDRPDDIPQWAWDYALEAYKASIDRPIWAGSGFEMMARAIIAAVEEEREEIISLIENGDYLDGSYIETSDDEIYLIVSAIRNRGVTK